MKLNHLAIPYLAVLAFMFGSIITNGGVAWYETLALPAWSPSVGIVAFIWGVIYVLAAWSLLLVWNKAPRDARFKWVMGGFAFSTLVNLVWSIVFFQLHLFAASIWCALLLGVSVLVLITLVFPRSQKAALLLVPYTIWVFFAAYFEYVISLLNS